jgi:hypothetical protein
MIGGGGFLSPSLMVGFRLPLPEGTETDESIGTELFPIPLAIGTVGKGASWFKNLIGKLFGPRLVHGRYGVVSRKVLEAAAKASGPTVSVATRQTEAPQIGKALSVATGQEAEKLAMAMRPEGQLFRADIPQGLIAVLQRIGLAELRVVQNATGTVVGTEIRFYPAASEFIAPLFR